MTDYNVISERERGIWEGVIGGLVAGVVLTLWVVYGGDVMATFKVGQRVRKIGSVSPGDYQRLLDEYYKYSGSNVGISGVQPPVGTEGTITKVHGDDSYSVRYDGYPSVTGPWRSMGYTLAPLTDPKAEAFLESIRQLKPLPIQEVA